VARYTLSSSPPSANPSNPRLLCLLANGVLGCTLRFRPRGFPHLYTSKF
jgi:hypothetical protein